MEFDFTSLLDRHGMDSIAVDAESAPGFLPEGHTRNGFSRIPMWVADMNFPTVPSAVQKIIERAQDPAMIFCTAEGTVGKFISATHIGCTKRRV